MSGPLVIAMAIDRSLISPLETTADLGGCLSFPVRGWTEGASDFSSTGWRDVPSTSPSWPNPATVRALRINRRASPENHRKGWCAEWKSPAISSPIETTCSMVPKATLRTCVHPMLDSSGLAGLVHRWGVDRWDKRGRDIGISPLSCSPSAHHFTRWKGGCFRWPIRSQIVSAGRVAGHAAISSRLTPWAESSASRCGC